MLNIKELDVWNRSSFVKFHKVKMVFRGRTSLDGPHKKVDGQIAEAESITSLDDQASRILNIGISDRLINHYY